MADALCGPSNALSSFQKHAQVDRTLQQDRFTGPRQSPTQGFRSFDPRAKSLDADFHAFENASSSPFQLEQPAWRTDNVPLHPAQGPSGWASDFQNLRISNSPVPAHQSKTETPSMRSAPGDWQQEFARQRQGLSPIAQQKQPEQTYNQASVYSPFLGGPVYAPQNNTSISLTSMQQPEAQFNEADFEKAFQSAFDEIQAETSQLATESLSVEPVSDIDQSIMESVIHEPSQMKIGSDAIEYTESKDRTIDQDSRDANELARVAGQLVQNVSHETDQKFKNSQFLDLMRRIRDREIEVRNNDFEIAQQTNQPQNIAVPPEEQASFQFPNMNNVYQPNVEDLPMEETFQYPPRNQISDLHPGGPFYPEQSSPRPEYARMSGAIESTVVAEDNSRYALA